MLLSAKNGTVQIPSGSMDYITFGEGPKNLVMLPGLSDGLKTVKGVAVPFALMYREYAKSHRVYVFSRNNRLPESITSRQMAEDVAAAMEQLGISSADVMGVSQGGTIAQYLAIDHPRLVNRLVLAVTYARSNPTLQDAVSHWIKLAQVGDFSQLWLDTAERTYSPAYLQRNRKWFPILKCLGKPKSFDRFLRLAEACLTHNAFEELGQIACPTLVIGGKCDQIITGQSSVELAEHIKDSQLHLYPQYGHGAYEEAEGFNRRVLTFLNQ